MNALWAKWKRHYVLFNALSKIPEKLNVALIGAPWGLTKERILALAEYFNVSSQVSIFERIPFSEVMEITCQAKLGILCTLKEGTNRGIAEELFCNIPIIILKETLGGAASKVTPQTGRIIPEKYLSQGILEALTDIKSFTPRSWAIENCSCFVSTNKLNTVLKENALISSRPWTMDIVAHSSSPELRYCDITVENNFKNYNSELTNFFR
jgi:hypothetical protein